MWHISEKGLKVLQSAGNFPKLKSVNLRVCEDYIHLWQVKFLKKKNETKDQKLELVHSDVWGSASGSRSLLVDSNNQTSLSFLSKSLPRNFASNWIYHPGSSLLKRISQKLLPLKD